MSSIDAALVRAVTRRKLFGTDEPPVKVGRFVIEKRLGSGGMGVVYQATDPELGRQVAIKLLHETADAERLREEARALASLRHPNVVAVHDVGTWDDRVFLAMELISGGTLRSWLRARPRGWREIAGVMAKVARALGAAHAAGLAHRDVKPENVLIGDADDGEVRVADFGLATRAGTGRQPAGTAGYVAPECLQGKPADALSDQFSFCVMLYEAFAGQRPTKAGRAPLRLSVPSALRRALLRGLQTEPQARHASMAPLVALLERDRRALGRAIAITGVLIAGAVATTVAVAGRRADPCAGGPAQMHTVWNPERRDAMEKAFAATGLPYAADSFHAAAARLDDEAKAWTVGYRSSCQATFVRHEQSQAMLDKRSRCLAQRKAALAATVELLAGGGPDVVARAAHIVGALPSVDGCSDLVALAAIVPPPDDPETRRKLAELEGRLTEPPILAAAERGREAFERAQALVADARELGYQPALAESMTVLGTIQAMAGQPVSEQTFLDAIATAQASSHDVVVADGVTKLMSVYSYSQSRWAHVWARLAEATLQRLGHPARLTAEYEAAYGNLASEDDKFDEAIEHLQAALAANERAEPKSVLEEAHYLNDLGIALDGAGRYDEARARFEAALAIEVQQEGAVHPEVARSLYNLAVFEQGRKRHEAALDHLARAREILATLGTTEIMLAAQIEDLTSVSLGELGRVDEALAKNDQAQALYRKLLGPDDALMASPLLDRGNLLLLAKRPAEALDLLQRSLHIYEQKRGKQHPSYASALARVGMAEVALGRLDEGYRDCTEGARLLGASTAGAEDLPETFACMQEAHIGLLTRTLGAKHP